MGIEHSLTAVADAGPLIHLSQIRALPLLCIFSTVRVPGAVWRETVGASKIGSADIEAVPNIERHELDSAAVLRFVKELQPLALHRGEAEALLLCREMASPLLLADDLAAREAARRQGVRPVGSLGIVVRAYRAGHIPLSQAEDYIRQLYRVSSLFVTAAIADMAIRQLR